MKHSDKDTKRYKKELTLRQLAGIKDEDIDYSDIPEITPEMFAEAVVGWPPRKKSITLRLDEDVLKWMKSFGKGYQTRINKLLRQCMEASKES